MTPAVTATIVFFSTSVFFLALFGLWAVYQQGTAAKTDRRLHDLKKDREKANASTHFVKERRLNVTGDKDNPSLMEKLQRWIVQAGMDISSGQLCAVSLAVGAGSGILCLLLTGNIELSFMLSLCVALMPFVYIAFKRHFRSKAFERQLPKPWNCWLVRFERGIHSHRA